MEFGCIGEHLTHSFSKEVHARIGAYPYDLCEIEKCNLDAFLLKKDFLGINVTIPYKKDVIPYLSYISDEAKEIGAVNTVLNRNGRLYGYNTDFAGMASLFSKLGLSLNGKKVLILGTGGTAQTAKAVASHLGAKDIICVSRTESNDAISYECAKAKHTDAEILINTTPCGMYPDVDKTPIELENFTSLEGVVDAIYNPLRSKLVLNAQARGILAAGGLYMLVAQAVYAARIFQGKDYPQSVIDEIYKSILAEKQNIVLIGMPGCGKTTLGKALAKALGKEFLDTDDLILKKHKQNPGQIIASVGESAFRDMESEVIEVVSALNGCIIATGGGAVLREENVYALKQNGMLFFLDRNLDDLMPTPDRPLSSTKEAIEALYRERYGIYTSVSDERIVVEGGVNDVLENIIMRIK